MLEKLLDKFRDERSTLEKDELGAKERRLVYGKNHDEQSVKRRNLFEMAATTLEAFAEDELEVIMECEDEAHRKGHFELTFPCQGMDRYMKFFASQRWSNIILCTWYRNKDWRLLKPYLARIPPGVDLNAKAKDDRPCSGQADRRKRGKAAKRATGDKTPLPARPIHYPSR